MKRCTKCVMPETWPGISFDEGGICSICRENEKEIDFDWNKRQEILKEILKKYKNHAKEKGNKYDCLVGYSGGKDSAYILWAAVKKYGMTPLVATFDHSFKLSEDAEYNLMEIPKKLNCDHIRFTIGNDFRNALCKKGIEVMGDFCWHCHNGVGTLPARISKQWDIPLQIWGEPSAKYQTYGAYSYDDLEEQDEEHYKKVFQAGITPEIILPEGYEFRDLLPFMWPQGVFELKAIYLGNFEPWDQREHVDIITKELGWRTAKVEGTYVNWDKVDCPYEPVRDWQKWMKFKFARTTFQASKDIREGRITREAALKLIEKYDGNRPRALDAFIKETKISEEDFNRLTKESMKKRK